jgi:hypothetical protein
MVEPAAEDMLRVPIPIDLRDGRIKVTVTMEPVTASGRPAPATPAMIQRRKEAFEALRKLNPFRDIEDPVAWQREIRRDKPLPGRD